MKICVLVFTTLLALPTPVAALGSARDAGTLAVRSVLTFDEAGAKERPVTKVIDLLKDMLKQLEKEKEEDEEIYDKLACWCETNDKEKTQAIADAEDRIAMLTTKVQELTASSARLGSEIKKLGKEVEANQEALDEATAIREKELAEFNAEEKDLLESITALKAAITVLQKHHSFLQTPGVVASIKDHMHKHAHLLKDSLTDSQRSTISAYLQAPQDYFDSGPLFKDSYVAQSGQIFGILEQMKETFESNLSAEQKAEMKAAKAYEDLKAAKEAEIAAGLNAVDKKTAEKADTDQKNAQAKEDIEDTKTSLAADEQFLMMLKEKCSMTDAEWEERQKTREAEMDAVSKALSILSTDDAHDLFTRTFNPSLLQSGSTLQSARRTEASKLLASVAQKVKNPRLATLAVSVRLDAFTKVKKAIDDMISDLLLQKENEIKLKDFCVGAYFENDVNTKAATREKTQTETKIAQLEKLIKELTEAIEELEAEIKELKAQLKKATEDRDKANEEFQLTVADQRATQKLLTKALDALKSFYAKSLLQQMKQPAGPPPPPGFQEYKNSAASGGVMDLIQQIIDDAKTMEKETIRSEKEAQEAYDAFKKETETSIDAKTKDIADKSDVKAKSEQELVDAKEALDDVMIELEQLGNAMTELKQECQFTLDNFEVRQTARDQEVEALKQAKAILSGADFKAMLQRD